MSEQNIHYYGDLVRKLFMTSAVFMVIGMPIVWNYIPTPMVISLAGILLLGIFAGLTNPLQTWVMLLNLVISLLGTVAFEYYAVDAFLKRLDFFFVVNQILALVFLFALYYSTKTLRGKLLK